MSISVLFRLPGARRAQRLGLLGLALFGLILTVPANSPAQQVMRIAAVVNNDIITGYEVSARMRIVFVSTGLRPTKAAQRRVGQRVLRNLIDEKLQAQEAKKRNVSVTQGDIRRAIANLEQSNGVQKGQFRQFLRAKRIEWDAMDQQIRAQVIWQKLIARVLRHRIVLSEDEIDETLEELKARKGSNEFQISEILLTSNSQDEAPATEQNARRLVADIRRGARFEALARQFSESASASVGGNIGWLQEETLPQAFRNVVPRMNKGDIAGPLQAVGGYYIIRLNDKRKILAGSPLDARLTLRRVMFPLPRSASQAEIQSQSEIANILRETVNGCADFDTVARETGFRGNTSLGTIKLGDLAKPVQQIVQNAPLGKPTETLRTAEGISVFMVCDRKAANSGLPSRRNIRDRLIRERLDITTRRFMRDLRAAAVVDIRA